MKNRIRSHKVWISLAFTLVILPLVFIFQNCTGGGFSTTELESAVDQLPLAVKSCTLMGSNGEETRTLGSTAIGYMKESVTFPEACTKVTRTCGDQGWDGEVPQFDSCQQKCLNPTTQKLETCPSSPTSPKPVTKFPTWRQGMKAWEWKKIDGSDISLITPKISVTGELSARIDSSVGLATDTVTNKLYSAANGGGTDYSGNEVYEIDLASDSPKWRLLREPTPSDLITVGDATKDVFNDYYKDNRPSSTHSYYSLQFISAKQSIFKFGAGATWGTGSEGNVKTDSYSIPFNDWFSPGTFPDILPTRSSTKDVSICKNPLTEEIYINIDRLRKFDPSKGTYTALASRPDGSQATDDAGGGCAVDTRRKQILFFKNEQSPADGGFLYNMTTDQMTSIKFSGPALKDVREAVAGYGYYDPTFDVYIFKDQASGGRIFRINPDTYQIHQIITTGGDAIPEAPNGVYTKFAHLPNLKGYVYYPKSGSGIWFLATE